MLEFIKRHFKKPQGFIGKITGKIMDLENRKLNKWAIRYLKVKPKDHILEIGFGPGYAIRHLLNRYKDIRIDGIDISETMRQQAMQSLDWEAIKSKVHLSTGDIAKAQLPMNSYDKVLTVNNYTLWGDKESGLENIYGALKPGGKIVIVMQPRQDDAVSKRAKQFGREIKRDLRQCRFRRIKVYYRELRPEMAVCVTAKKP